MAKDYELSFELKKGWYPFITSSNPQFSFINKLCHFSQLPELENLIKEAENRKNKSEDLYEKMTPTESFVRITNDAVSFGQYIDENIADLDEFKDYYEEGEKIYGSISPEDFIEIAKQWREFLIKVENDKSQKPNE